MQAVVTVLFLFDRVPTISLLNYHIYAVIKNTRGCKTMHLNLDKVS